MKKKQLLRKVLAGSLAIAMVGGTALATPVGSMIGANISASAASSSSVVTVGDYQYVLYNDGTAQVVGYTGTKNLSTTSVGMPSVIYAKDIDTTWSYIDYFSSFNVTSMQASIFNGCIFKTLTLPNKLQSLLGSFNGAEIGGFYIDSNNNYFTTDTSTGAYALYNKSVTTLYAYPSNPGLYTSGFGTATKAFPSTLTRIEDGAFVSSKLRTVTIPGTVTYMGDELFKNSAVNYVIFAGNAPQFKNEPGVQVEGHAAFEGASNLYQIKINGTGGNYSTDSYGNLYNKDKTKLVLVPQGKAGAFNIASTCTEIGNYAFKNSNATPVIYDQVKTIGTYAFSGIKSNFKIYCLKDTTAETVAKNKSIPYTYIYEYTTADDGVTITKYNGPYTSPGLPTSINGKDVIAIGDEAFKNNTSVTAVYMYSPLASIGKQAFYGCTKMNSVSIPYTLTDIGERAFYGCSALTSVSLPTKLNKIGIYAFGNCTGLTSVTIPNSVTTLSSASFYGCSKLTNVKLGTGLKTIGAYAFENTGLTTQYIPKNVTSIGSDAFGYNYSDSTHSRNSSFTSISGYPDTAAEKYANNNDITFNSVMTYTENDDGTVNIKKYTGTDTSVTIPSTIAGKTVTGIDGYAFNGSSVVSVTLPSSMTKIDGYAFYGAFKLTSVTIPSTITSIGSYAFEFCTSLKSINIPGTIKSIGTGAFYGCTALSSVTLNSGLLTIGKKAFTNTAMTAVTIPKTVTTISEHAFGYNYANSTYTGVSGFKMTGYVDTAAETYASNNTNITFVPQYETFVNNSTINKTSMTLGDTATITAAAAGGKKSYKYAVYYKKSTDSTSTTLQSYSTNTKINFTPDSSGTYTVTVTAADNRGINAIKTFTVTVTAPALVNESTVSDTSATVGDTITINSKASGGEGEYTYQVSYRETGSEEETIVQNYSANSSVEINFADAGNYTVYVIVKDGNGTVADVSYIVTVNEKVVEPLKNNSTISASSVTANTEVTINGKAEGGTEPYKFAYYYKKSTDSTWTKILTDGDSAYVTATTAAFKPTAAGTYNVKINVKDNNGTGTAVSKEFTVTVKAVNTPLANNSTISAANVTANTEVTISGKATGGTSPYKFAYYYKKSADSTYTKILTDGSSAYVTATSATFKPTSAGTYDVKVNVKDNNGTGTAVSKEFTVKVTASAALKNNSSISAATVKANTEVTLTGAATGGTEPYKFAYYYKKSADSTWTRVYTTPAGYAYTKNTTMPFKPTAAGTYDIRINVKDNNGTGTVVSKDFTLKVTAENTALANNSTISSASVAANTEVTLSGKATGGTSPYKFAYYYKKSTDSSYTKILTDGSSAYVTATTAAFKPTETGTYNVRINVKDNNGTGTVVTKDFTLTVTAENTALKNNSTISATSIAANTEVTLNGKATGGTSPYKFAYYYKKSTDSSYTKLLTDGSSAYVTATTAAFKPTEAGTYNVRINVKDNNGTGTVVSKDFTLKVN